LTRRGFTLIELLVAGIMATIVLGGITISLSQLGSAKAISRQRLEAFSRCDAALRTIRKETITVLRRGDLFDTRILISDLSSRYGGMQVQRDELLVFNSNLRANKEIDFNGEGLEYESQFRIEDGETGLILWKRRDPILDDNPIGGGIATPIAEGIVSLQIEAFDGASWFEQWDSDESGIPEAIRITVTSTGMELNDVSTRTVTLRTVVPLDRVRSPQDKLVLIAQLIDDARVENGELDGDGEGGLGDGGAGTGGGTSDGEGDDGGGSAGGSGTGTTGGRDPSGTGNDGGGGSTGVSNAGTGTTIFVDPDGNEHEIPNP
jgi:type II secretory pathway component PulJ